MNRNNGRPPGDLYVSNLNVENIININRSRLRSQRGIFNDIETDSLTASSILTSDINVSDLLKLPLTDTSSTSPSVKGTIVYDFELNNIRISTGENWVEAGTPFTLPPPLSSISGLTTTGNEMLYTIATDIYDIIPTTSIGRSWLGLNSISAQRNSLGLTIGGSIQAHSDVLDDIVTNSSPSGNMLFSNGTGYSLAPSMNFGRSLLNMTNASELNSTLGTITGTSITNSGRVVRISGTQTVEETGVNVDGSDNVSGVNDLSILGNMSVTGNIDGISPAERSQLTNIDTTTISSVQWEYLGNMNQNVNTSSTPQFNGMNANNQNISNASNPVNPQDVATKNYVDTVAASGAPPLIAANYATAQLLIFSPNYASPAETLTATINGLLVVDGSNPGVGSRILVKNQADDRENGVYIVTDDGSSPGPLYVLTRSEDFNQSAMPVLAGTHIFIEVSNGVANDATTWALNMTTHNIDPLTDSVIFVQTGGNETFTPGQGIMIPGSSIQIDNTARFGYTGNSLDLNTVTVPYGGTGKISFTPNNVLIGNGTDVVNDSKPAPTGEFVGTTDSQTFINKTIDDITNTVRATSLATVGSPVVVEGASSPSIGQALIATGATAASWQTLPTSSFAPDRTLFVYQSAPNISPNYDGLQNAITRAIALTPTQPDPVMIILFPGTYAESIPVIVPQHVSISTIVQAQGSVIITPDSGVAQPVFSLSGNTRLSGLYVDGLGTATIGYEASATPYSTDVLNTCTATNCATAGFRVTGNGGPFSRILVCRNTLARAVSSAMINGYEVRSGAILAGTDFNATAFASGGGTLTNGFNIHDDFTIADVNIVSASSCSMGILVGPKTTTTTQNQYPKIRAVGVNLGFINFIGVSMKEGSAARFSDLRVDESFAPVPIHLHIENPNTGDPNFLGSLWMNVRFDKFIPNANGGSILPEIIGSDLSEIPGNIENKIAGELTVGMPKRGFNSNFGEGGPHNLDMEVFIFDSSAGSSTNITSIIKVCDGSEIPAFPTVPTANDALYIGGGLRINKFFGIVIKISAAISATSGVVAGVNWEYWNGSSWNPLSLMSTENDEPYETKTDVTFGEGDTIISSKAYSYRFGNLDNWATTLAGAAGITLPAGMADVLRFYVRARVTGVGTITTVPVIQLIRLQTSCSEFTKMGFLQYFGNARPFRKEQISTNDFTATGIGGESSPNSSRLTGSTINNIASVRPNSRFSRNGVTAAVYIWTPPNEMDTSENLFVIINYSRSTGNSGDVVMQVDYAITRENDIIGNPGNGAANPVVSTGLLTFPVPTSDRRAGKMKIPMNITKVNPITDSMWFKFYRLGNNFMDTYNRDIYIIDIDFEYKIWAEGTLVG